MVTSQRFWMDLVAAAPDAFWDKVVPLHLSFTRR